MHTHSLRIGALSALVAVALGAFGAHALKPQLIENSTLETWKTAVDYQMWHALALVALAGLGGKDLKLRSINLCFGLGMCFFSGSLYWLALGGPKWLGPITPIGGLLLMLGWIMLLRSSGRLHREG
jgi:uncharacterized membrane protein YgdD (TMEM256/DUF423 family)